MERKKDKIAEARINEYLAAGISPLEWRLYPVRKLSDGSRLGWFSRLYVNSLKLGALAPETYEPCTAATLRGAKLAMRQLEEADRLFDSLSAKGEALPLVTVSMPLKMFLGKTSKRAFEDFLGGLTPQKASALCLAFTPELLFMKREEINPRLADASKLGIRTALAGYGEEYCPPLRLKGLRFDYVIYAPEFSRAAARGEADATALAEMAGALGYARIARTDDPDKYFGDAGLDPSAIPADYVTGGAGLTVRELLGEVRA